jgi:hypothetical protein
MNTFVINAGVSFIQLCSFKLISPYWYFLRSERNAYTARLIHMTEVGFTSHPLGKRLFLQATTEWLIAYLVFPEVFLWRHPVQNVAFFVASPLKKSKYQYQEYQVPAVFSLAVAPSSGCCHPAVSRITPLNQSEMWISTFALTRRAEGRLVKEHT